MTKPSQTPGHAATLAVVRGALMAIFLLAALGTAAELLLIGHTEGPWQLAPLILILMSLIAVVCHAAARRAATVRVFQATMVLFIASGAAGMVLHYQGKAAFKREINPDLAGMELFWEAISGSAVPPVLAPAMMTLLGLLGLLWTYRHPATRSVAGNDQLITTGA